VLPHYFLFGAAEIHERTSINRRHGVDFLSPAPFIDLVEKIASIELVTRGAGVVRSQSETVQVSNPVRFEASHFLIVNLIQSALVQGITIHCALR
jgi:hypothetical protein